MSERESPKDLEEVKLTDKSDRRKQKPEEGMIIPVMRSTKADTPVTPHHNLEESDEEAHYEFYLDENSAYLKKSTSQSKINFENLKKTDAELKGIKQKKIMKYYKSQNDLIESFKSLDKLHSDDPFTDGEEQNQEKESRAAKILINVSFATNVILFILKIYASAVSGSLSVIASALDSFLDLLSGSIIFLTNFLMRRVNPYKYPAGRDRLEPLGIIVFSACMFTAALQLITQSVQQFIEKKVQLDLTPPTIVVIVFTIVSKLTLFLFCRLNKNPSVQALAQDHRNDVVSNSVGVACACIGFFTVLWWFDALGAVLIALYIMTNWFRTGYEYVKNLSGRSASPVFLQQLTYLAWNHDPRIIQIDTVRAFRLGMGYIVEVDIVLPEDMPLKEAHDIGEALQIKLEQISSVERAFVHLDFETDHRPEHGPSKKMGLVEIDS